MRNQGCVFLAHALLFQLLLTITNIRECLCWWSEDAPGNGARPSNPHRRETQNIIHIEMDIGRNVTIFCGGVPGEVHHSVMWVRNGKAIDFTRHTHVTDDGALHFASLDDTDSGLYWCDDEEHQQPGQQAQLIQLRVRTPPRVSNLTIHASTILALVMWNVDDDGGYPIDNFQLQYAKVINNTWPPALHPNNVHTGEKQLLKRASSTGDGNEWWTEVDDGLASEKSNNFNHRRHGRSVNMNPLLEHSGQMRVVADTNDRLSLRSVPIDWHWANPRVIGGDVRQMDVYHLDPNSTYRFRLWATNVLGPGLAIEAVAVTQNDTTEMALAKRLLSGVDEFDTRVWVAAVSVVMIVVVALGSYTLYMIYTECYLHTSDGLSAAAAATATSEEHVESIELVPNIILNPCFDGRGTGGGGGGRVGGRRGDRARLIQCSADESNDEQDDDTRT